MTDASCNREARTSSMPVPEDFDVFWDARMAEADAAPLEWELVPAQIPSTTHCEYWELWFAGVHGERVFAKYLKPVSADPVPVVLQFHGYPGASRSWFEQSSFVGMGCAIIAMDDPGQGGRSVDASAYAGPTVSGHLIAGLDGDPKDLYYVHLYQNIRMLARVVSELDGIDLARVYVNGASQGGASGIACCALNAGLIKRAAILYPFLSDFGRVFYTGADTEVYDGLRYYSRWFDPEGEREGEWLSKLAYYDTASFAPRVSCPVLFGTGLADAYIPPATQDTVYERLACEKERRFFEGKGHEEIEAFDDEISSFLGEDACVMEELSLEAADGTALAARFVAPEGPGPHPAVVLFHDAIRDPRGWLHLRRYPGAGMAVLELENRAGALDDIEAALADALVAFDALAARADVDASRILAFGEGTGGALALYVAEKREPAAVAAANPYPCAPLMEAAPAIACPALIGTSRMDEIASPAEQDALAERIAHAVHKNYPRYIHERINAFEDALLAFSIQHLL